MSEDVTEPARRARMAELRAEPSSREDLEARYGQVWDTDQLCQDFEVIGFMAPLCVVRRQADGQKGSLEFVNHPRLYFNWEPYEA